MARIDEERHRWLKVHDKAHWVVFDTRTSQPIGAIYYAPDWYYQPEVHEAELKRFFALVEQARFERGDFFDWEVM